MNKKIYVILYLSLILFFFCKLSIAGNLDTTLKVNLFESQKNSVKISFLFDESNTYLNGVFTISIDGFNYTDSTQNALDYYELKIVDLDKDDDYKEIALVTYMNDFSEYLLYRFTGKKIISLGWVTSMNEPIFTGEGTVKAKGWMGFWSYDYSFVYDKTKKKYVPVYKDEYPVVFYEGFEGEIIVKENFSTYKEKDIKSDVISKFKPGDKIKLLKAYINVKCNNDFGESCYWYLIQDKNGKKGWLQLKDFMDKVDGLPWAG
jgi:hypothetical protein